MASIEQRPYVGTWELNNRRVVKYTPDALVYINGDTSIPGCPSCRGRIDIQQFVTGMSVDAGTEPTSHSSTINLTLPKVQGQQLFIDGAFVLRPGLEVHIFFRGYFPVQGMFSHLPDPQIDFPNASGTNKLDLSKFANYPYYPVFHGVIINAKYEYSDGFYYGTLSCASLLHFWNYQNISTSAAWLGLDKKPDNDVGRPTLYGHNLNGMHPFGVIYTCYRDVAGAAAGVDYALDEASNLQATADIGDRQLFDQIVSYWDQRFRTRIQSLRMYGVNGQLFNGAQQAFFARNANNLDIEALIPSTQYGEPENQRGETDPFSVNLAAAKALGLGGAGPDMVWAPFVNAEGQTVSLSLLDQWGFTPAMGDLGSVNEWLSTYQTKMDVAQTTCEITGYEFFQDVDGDLVFKPPFYNLDTSTNRYYRLEDIDLINISFDEKEPSATYINVKASWVKGLTDVLSNSDATHKRAFYVDYKLVAQFGWRGASWEISYVVDTRMLFYLGIARMDLLNIDVNSASCTIPIRPELRPGYPVYIPFCDCYYYISQMSHTFSFGGQCTTTLVLTCRRTKFHAPGFLTPPPLGKSAIDLIRLDRPSLPARPLEVINGGIPRLIGFPNVVMALDPTNPNPNFSPVGIGIDYINSVKDIDMVFNIIRRDIMLLDMFETPTETENVDGSVRTADPENPEVFRLRWGRDPGQYTEFSLNDLKESFLEIEPILSKLRGTRGPSNKPNSYDIQTTQLQLKDARQQETIWNQTKFTEGASGSPRRSDQRAALEKQLATLQRQEAIEEAALATKVGDASPGGDGNLLVQILNALNKGRPSHTKRKIDGLPQSEVTLAYFESLSHLKGQFTNAGIPGHYRYYSCSHPDPAQQGQPVIIFDDGDKQNPESAGQQGQSSQSRRTPARTEPENVVFIPKEGSIFDQLNKGLASIPGLDEWVDRSGRNKLEGLYSDKSISIAPDLMNENYAQNILDIASVANDLVANVRARPEYQNAIKAGGKAILDPPELISGFRPDLEPAASEALHSQGLAIDIKFSEFNFASAKDTKNPAIMAAHSAAVNIWREEALKLFQTNDPQIRNNPQINGMGIYAIRKGENTPSFIHIDRRDSKSQVALAQKAQNSRDAYDSKSNGSRKLEAPTYTGPVKANGQANLAKANGKQEEEYRARKDFFEDIGVADKITGVKGSDKAPRPPRVGSWYEPKEWLFDKEGNKLKGVTWKSFAELHGFGKLRQFGREPAPPRFKVDIRDSTQAPQPIPTDESPPTVTNELPAEPAPIGRVETQEISLEQPRLVVQFQRVVKKESENERAPDVILATGPCSKGLNVATGTGGLPRVLTTDQIQTLSFSFFSVNKFAEVVGTSQTSASLNFNGEALSIGITEVFIKLAGNLDDGKLTPNDVYKQTWDAIRVGLQAIRVPIYQGQGLQGVTNDALAAALAAAVESGAFETTVQSTAAVVETDATGKITATAGAVSIKLESIDIGEFADAVIINLNLESAGVQQLYPGQTSVVVAETDFDTLSQTNPYVSEDVSTTAAAVAKRYAGEITKKVNALFNKAYTAAAIPPDLPASLGLTIGRQQRVNSVASSLNEAANIASGNEEIEGKRWVRGTEIPIKTYNEGKTQKPKFAPIFPVSDEKGYRHYGAFRYGRGLSVDQGGTFEFLHSGNDPFQNVSAQSAEEFIQALTLSKSGLVPSGQKVSEDVLRGIADAYLHNVIVEQQGAALPTTEPVVDQPARPPVQQAQLQEAVEGLQTLQGVGLVLRGTPDGQEALRELLEMNGDNPDVINQSDWDITNTQFARHFANYAATIGKTDVFKTTVANAAYRLSDITSHLLVNTGHSCVCRGSLSDVVMSAYSQERFLVPEGIDQEHDKATASEAEKILQGERAFVTQRDLYSGKVTTPPTPDANAFHNARGNIKGGS